MTVEEMLRRMSSREFSEWMAYDRLEGIGQPRDDARFGLLASLIANVNRDRSRHPEPYEVKDFMVADVWGAEPDDPEQDEPEDRLTPEETADAIHAVFGVAS